MHRRYLIAIATALLLLALIPFAFADEGPLRPMFAVDIGPFVTMHYLDHNALNNYLDRYGIKEMDEMTLGYGLGSRVLGGPLQISSHLEGWGSKTSGKGSDASIWGLSLVGRMGFTVIRRTFLSVLYFGPGLDYSELNINGKNPLPDFSGWKLGLLGDVGMSFEYLFPIGLNRSGDSRQSATNLPIGVQVGYAGEIITDPWYQRSGQLDAVVKDRFMGLYVRFGINIGTGSYTRAQSIFELPEDDFWPTPPNRKKRKHPEPEPSPEPEDEPDRVPTFNLP